MIGGASPDNRLGQITGYGESDRALHPLTGAKVTSGFLRSGKGWP